MSTVVLARKYRPRRFDQMVGQDHVVKALTHALEQNRLHHAYLFTGTRGIGKTTVSRILAKSLNCTGPDGQGGVTAQPCGVCSACTEIDADRYIDYIELDAASNRSIDEIRDLIERAAYKPGVGRFKVFMIDEAHQLTKDAFNALLKTLEEPPDYLKFVLATTDPEKMLPTVLSRCLQFNLRPMAPEVVRDHLAQVLAAEDVPHDAGALRLLGRAARGSMRDALSLADQAIAYGGGRLSEDAVAAMLGSVDRSHAAGLIEALAARDGAAVLAAVDALRLRGSSAAGLLDEMTRVLQLMAIEQAVPQALDEQDPEQADARRLAPLLTADATQLLYSIALHGRAELALMSDEHAALTMVLLRFLAFPSSDADDVAPTGPPRNVPAPRGVGAPARPSPTPGAARLAPASPVASGSMAVVAAPAAAPAAPRPTEARRAPAVTVPDDDIPPWVDAPPEEADPEPSAAPWRAMAPPSLALPVAGPAASAERGDSSRRVPEPVRTPLGDRWQAVVKSLVDQGRIAALTRELAWQAGALAFDEVDGIGCWRLCVERESLRSPALREKLEAALTAEAGAARRVEIEPGVPDDSPARRDAAERARRQVEAEDSIHQDPLVQDLLRQFKTARIVPGSIKPL